MRFVNEDPLRDGGNLNLYSDGFANPVNLIDRFGLSSSGNAAAAQAAGRRGDEMREAVSVLNPEVLKWYLDALGLPSDEQQGFMSAAGIAAGLFPLRRVRMSRRIRAHFQSKGGPRAQWLADRADLFFGLEQPGIPAGYHVHPSIPVRFHHLFEDPYIVNELRNLRGADQGIHTIVHNYWNAYFPYGSNPTRQQVESFARKIDRAFRDQVIF